MKETNHLSPAQKEIMEDVTHAFNELKESLFEVEPRNTFERELAMNHLYAAEVCFKNSVIQSDDSHRRRELIREALGSNGGPQKQYYLLELAKLDHIDFSEYGFDFGIAPSP